MVLGRFSGAGRRGPVPRHHRGALPSATRDLVRNGRSRGMDWGRQRAHGPGRLPARDPHLDPGLASRKHSLPPQRHGQLRHTHQRHLRELQRLFGDRVDGPARHLDREARGGAHDVAPAHAVDCRHGHPCAGGRRSATPVGRGRPVSRRGGARPAPRAADPAHRRDGPAPVAAVHWVFGGAPGAAPRRALRRARPPHDAVSGPRTRLYHDSLRRLLAAGPERRGLRPHGAVDHHPVHVRGGDEFYAALAGDHIRPDGPRPRRGVSGLPLGLCRRKPPGEHHAVEQRAVCRPRRNAPARHLPDGDPAYHHGLRKH